MDRLVHNRILAWGLFAVVLLVLFAAGCTATIPTVTLNDKIALGLNAATALTETDTALLQSGKISKAENDRRRASTDLIVASLQTAASMQATSPDQATALIVAALNALAAVKAPLPPGLTASGAAP